MNTPTTLNQYFSTVDDFLKKTFRDDSRLFVAVKSRQNIGYIHERALLPAKNENVAKSIDATEHIETTPSPVSSTVAPVESTSQDAPATSIMDSGDVNYNVVSTDQTPAVVLPTVAYTPQSYIYFSPRMSFDELGNALGKMKVSLGLRIPHICKVEQGLILNNMGIITSVTRVRELLDGLMLGMRMSVNAIAPASQDTISGTAFYRRRDFYSLLGYQRNNLGSSNLVFDFGSSYWNCLFGAGFERQQLSYYEQKDGSERFDVMYGGVGFSDVNWSIGAKMVRTIDAWTNLRVSALQRLTPTTALACSYNFDITQSLANVTVGCSQGFRLCLPSLLQPSRLSTVCDAWTNGEGCWSTTLPFIIACKADTSGDCAGTLRAVFNDSVRWSVVVRKNMITPSSSFRYGFTLSTETEA